MKEAKTNRSLHKLMSIMAAMLLLFLNACKAVPIEEEIAGTYKPSACVSLDGKEFEIEDEVLHMEKDGTGYFILHNNKYEIRWEYKDGKGSLDHGFASYVALALPSADLPDALT